MKAHRLAPGTPDPNTLLCFVSDTGIGIAEGPNHSAFHPFTQVDGSYTRKFQGYVAKPVELKELQKELNRALENGVPGCCW